MDKLVAELITLLREMLASQERLLNLALVRREAMRTFDIPRLEGMVAQEQQEAQSMAALDRRRMAIVSQFKMQFQKMGLMGVTPTVSEISRRVGEPTRTMLLGLAGQVREGAENVERNTRINATVSETVVKGLAKVLKVVTGLAQHAGLYMRNGRKAALHGIHLLEVTA
jgi:hypothetical protein